MKQTMNERMKEFIGKILDAEYLKGTKKTEVISVEQGSNPVKFAMEAGVHYFLYVAAGVEGQVVIEANNSAVLEVFAEENSNVEVVISRLSAKDVENFLAAKARIEKGARIDWFLNVIDCEIEKWFVQTHVAGTEGTSNINLAFYGQRNQQMKIFAGNIFDAKNCKGKIMAKGVVADKSKVGFVGEIDITLQGGGTDSYLKEDVLMLDPTAKIDAIPSLEIKTNDVKAGHGVSISKLNEDKLFYLTSRGVTPDVARKLVLVGFLRDLYYNLSDREVVESIDNILEQNDFA